MPKIVDHDERRSTLAAAAAEAIADDGIDNVTLKSIGRRAGVTTGAVTHYFADKEQLMLAALLHADAAMHARLDAALTLDRSSVEALLDVLPNNQASRREWLVWRAFNDAAIRSEHLRSQHRRSTAQWLETATTAIADRSGRAPEDVRLDAQLYLAVFNAIGDAACVDPDSWPIERQRQLLQHCRAGVLPT